MTATDTTLATDPGRAHYLFEGTVTSLDPITINPPGHTFQPKRSPESSRRPAQATIYRFSGEDASLSETVHIPGSSIRGKLRHLITNMVFRRLAAQPGSRLHTPFDYQLNEIGGVVQPKAKNGQKDPNASPSDDLNQVSWLRRNNPICSLFGTATPFTRGALRHVSHAVPKANIRAEEESSSRSSELERNPAVMDLLDPDSRAAFDAHRTIVKASSAARQAEKRPKAKTADTPADDAPPAPETPRLLGVQQTLHGQYLPPGLPMDQTMSGYMTTIELGLLLLGLNCWSLTEPFIGGKVNQGHGRLTTAHDLYRVDEMTGRELLARITFQPFLPISIDGPHAGFLRTAMADFVAALDAGAFDFRHASLKNAGNPPT